MATAALSRETPVLILPGWGDSGPDHWQSLWQAARPNLRRVEQRDWFEPELGEWVETLEQAVKACERPPVLVAHSLACATVAHWANRFEPRARGALLVSPADVDSEDHTPPEVRGFGPIPLRPLPFPTIVVTSTDDPFVDVKQARLLARAWNARLVVLDRAGHINADSGFGFWPEGQSLLNELLEEL